MCPLCRVSVRISAGEDANMAWANHAASGTCDAANYSKTAKRKCPVPGCREQLTFSNKHACKECALETW